MAAFVFETGAAFLFSPTGADWYTDDQSVRHKDAHFAHKGRDQF